MVGRWSAAVTVQASTRPASACQAALEGASSDSGALSGGSRSSSGLMMLSVWIQCQSHAEFRLGKRNMLADT